MNVLGMKCCGVWLEIHEKTEFGMNRCVEKLESSNSREIDLSEDYDGFRHIVRIDELCKAINYKGVDSRSRCMEASRVRDLVGRMVYRWPCVGE